MSYSLYFQECKEALKTRLFHAIENNDIPSAKSVFLVAGGFFIINETNQEGLTPIMYAAKYGSSPFVKLLAEKGAEINTIEEENKDTALTLAAKENNANSVSVLIDYGAYVNHKDKDGLNALFWAAYRGNAVIAEMLLKEGAFVNMGTKKETTPLMVAAKEGHKDVVTVLLKYGAAVNYTCKDGDNALMYAQSSNNTEIIKLLREYGAK